MPIFFIIMGVGCIIGGIGLIKQGHLKNGNIIKKGPTQDVLSRDLINDIYETDVTSYYELIHGKLF